MLRALAVILALACLLVAPAASAAPSSSATIGVTVPVPAAEATEPPPGVRTCTVQLDGASLVATDCPRPCYAEDWDGPLLHATNACERSIWASYLFQATDGRTYRTPCFELSARTTLTIPEAGLSSASRREVHVGLTPGSGWPATGFRLDCAPALTPVETPVWWIDDRWSATVHDGTLGPDAERPPQEGAGR